MPLPVTTEELQRDFQVIAFLAPFLEVIRKSDGIKGRLEFVHHPRTYFNWREDADQHGGMS